ncbi:hypothetical protein [Roseomonas indoligenes]|uniref:Uncharacterized protein n=1 Tax=Roseomonas indoligenes TaxID=2820811 RepID=A0A940N290_9PROT|nr:hypothetical protein [Pararoseomonas indoligenes]MBP0492892.1 hypothetical protein [Pararoseomonas indoligenes]
MSTDPLSPDIDSCRYLYLRRLWEPWENGLGVTVDEAVVGSGKVPDTATSVGPIVVGTQSRAFQLIWPRYVAYSVTNESYTVLREADRIASGRLLIRYAASEYLDHLHRATIYGEMTDFLGEMIHIRLVCLNHIIDVVSGDIPEVQSVPPRPWNES